MCTLYTCQSGIAANGLPDNGLPVSSSTSKRAPLHRQRALDAAVALADAQGIDAVSMRKLAAQLDVVPMALYKHVANKDDLLDGMVDTVITGYQTPTGDRGWKHAVRSQVLDARRALLRHPWLRPVIESRTRRTPTVLAYMDALAGRFIAGGFSVDLTHHVMHALGHRIFGFSPEAFNDPSAASAMPADPAAQRALVEHMASTYPNIAAIALEASGGDLSAIGDSCDEQFEFEFTLDLLLDAFERLRNDGWKSVDPTRAK